MDTDLTKNKPFFIVFEGIDESGKTTLAKHFAYQYGGVYSFEPGGYENSFRDLLVNQKTALADRTKALIFAADRAEHVDKTILPALRKGRHVFCDRYVPSSVAYQGAGGELGEGMVTLLSLFSCQELLVPDLIIWLDISWEEQQKRKQNGIKEADNFSDKDKEFYDRVTASYQRQYDSRTSRWVKLDASKNLWELKREISSLLSDLGMTK